MLHHPLIPKTQTSKISKRMKKNSYDTKEFFSLGIFRRFVFINAIWVSFKLQINKITDLLALY